MSQALSFLNVKNLRPYNVQLAKKLGCINAAIFLQEIIYQIDRFREKESEDNKEYILRRNGKEYIFLTLEDVENRTALTRTMQKNAEFILEKCELIEKIRKGSPPKRYYYVNEDKVLELFNLQKTCNSNCRKPAIASNNINKHEEIKREAPPQFSFAYEGNTFIRMPQEHYEKLVSENGNEKILEVLKEITDYVAGGGKPPKKDHAAYVRNWIRKDKKWNKPKKDEEPPPPVNSALPVPRDEVKEEHKKWVIAFMKKFGTRAVTKNRMRVIVNDATIEFYPDIDKIHMIESVSIYEKNYKNTALNKMRSWGIDTEGL